MNIRVAQLKEGYLKHADRFVMPVILLAALFILSPRYWEPGGESWGAWASARMLRWVGEFPVLSKGPAYVVYLLFFQWFDYPLSIRLEYVATHLFCYVAIYLMLKSVLQRRYAFLLTCAWIPMLAVTEGGGAIAGMGFLALYLRGEKCSGLERGYVPPLLGIAGLCHNVYLPFLFGHTLGAFIDRVRLKQPFTGLSPLFARGRRLSLAVNTALLILIVLSIISPVRHPHFSNHMMIDATYSPDPLADNMTTSFFHIGTYKWVMRNIPPSEWIHHDWYLNKEKAFGEAQTILQAVVSRPGTVIANLVENLHAFLRLPGYFLTGSTMKITSLFMNFVLLLLVSLGFAGLLARARESRGLPVLVSILFGTAAVIGALLLTSFSHRYIITLLPVGLLALAHMDKGIQLLCQKKTRDAINGHHRTAGVLLVAAGLLTSEWLLPGMITRKLTPFYRVEILLFNVFSVAAGCLLIFRKGMLANRPAKNLWSGRSLWLRNVLIGAGSVLVLWSAPYSDGWSKQMEAVFNGQPLLSEAKDGSFSMVASHEALFRSVNRQTRVLSYEHTWVLAYADVDFNKVYQMHSLPPFEDPSGETGRFLNGMDVIWVSRNFSAATHTIGASKYLRYRYHIKPFLDQALKRGWTVEHVEHFGSIYRRPI